MKPTDDLNHVAETVQSAHEVDSHEVKAYVAPSFRTLSTRETRISPGVTVTDGITIS